MEPQKHNQSSQHIRVEDYRVLGTKVVFDDPRAKILIDLLEHHGRQHPFFYLASPVDAVATVGLDQDRNILLTRQYRHPIGQIIFDLPAGRLEAGEDPLEGARREFEEETGYFPKRMEKLGFYHQFPGTIQAGTHLYFASELSPTQQKLDEGEFLEIVPMSISQVYKLIQEGEFVDGSLQLGVLLAIQKGYLKI